MMMVGSRLMVQVLCGMELLERRRGRLLRWLLLVVEMELVNDRLTGR